LHNLKFKYIYLFFI